MIADTLPMGPRRTAVARAEVEVTVAQEKLDLAMDNQDWADAVVALAQLRTAREGVNRILTQWILDIPGAEEFFNPKETKTGDKR